MLMKTINNDNEDYKAKPIVILPICTHNGKKRGGGRNIFFRISFKTFIFRKIKIFNYLYKSY
jgi:hypothetical protein